MNPSSNDPVEAIMADCLNRSEAEWQSAMTEACARHPELADRLRARFDSLQGWGLVQTVLLDSSMTGQRIGDYEVLGDLGAGTSATVLRARHVVSGEHVALKLLRNHMDVVGRWRERFQREQRVAQSLQHEGLCSVLAWGEHEGQPFLVLSLVDGLTLAAEIASGPATPDAVTRRLRVLMQVARALQYMHGCGLVHRDVKPGNIMVRNDGSAVLTDLGLAFDQEEGHSLTASNVLPGSPAYLAPELVQGGSRGSVSSDVFAMGVILHECATGSLPFQGPTRAALFHQILAGKRLPMAGAASLRRVANTAMAQQPRDRYSSAEELATDLERCLSGQRPIAQGPGAWRSLTGWVVRNYVATIIILMLALGGAVVVVAFERTQSALGETRMLALTLAARDEMHDNPGLALQLAYAVHQRRPSSASRSLLYEGLASLHAWRKIAPTDFPATVTDEPVIATAVKTGIRAKIGDGGRTVEVFDGDGTLIDRLPHPCAVSSVALSSTGAMLATGGGDGVLRLYQIHAEGRLLAALHGHRGVIRAVAFGRGDEEVFTLSDDGTARCWQVQATLARWRHPQGTALSGAVAVREGMLLLAQSPVVAPIVVDTASRRVSPPWLRDVRSVLDSSHRFLLQVSRDDPGIVDLAQGVRLPWTIEDRLVTFAAATKDCTHLFTTNGGQIYRWALRAGTVVCEGIFAEVDGEISAIAVARDGSRIVCGSTDGYVRVFLDDRKLLVERQLHRDRGLERSTSYPPNPNRVWSVALRDDGQKLLTASRDETAWCGSLNLGEGTVLKHSGTVLCAKFSRGETGLIATGCVDGVVRLSRDDGERVAELRGHGSQVENLTFAIDGRSLISASVVGDVRSWPVDEQDLLQRTAIAVQALLPIPERFEYLLGR
ncbi:MAG: WD40 repeat protein [Planctomycetota bacterium]|jgi:WD40 repeat protein